MTDRQVRYRPKPVPLEEMAMSVAEVAAELGVSQQRIRQLESSALRKLRAAMLEHDFPFRDFIEAHIGF